MSETFESNFVIYSKWWPNPYYDGVPVVHPEDSTGTYTYPARKV